MHPSRIRSFGLILALIVALLPVRLRAQSLTGIAVLKIDEYSQASDESPSPTVFDVSGEAEFSAALPASAQVTLISPSGVQLPLILQGTSEYAAYQSYATRAALEADFPDGTYRLVVSGVSSSFAVATGQPVPPATISNFTALQSWPNATPTIQWNAIPGATADDLLSLEISRSDGTVLASPSPAATATSYTGFPLPQGVALHGDLTYAHLATTFTTSFTIVAGHGFNVGFPLFCPVPPPTIFTSPASTAVAAGSSVTLSVSAGGIGLSYQWYHEGVPIAGATGSTFTIAPAAAVTGGNYSVAVTNASGTVMSDPANVAVGAALVVSTYAGVPPQGASGFGIGGYVDGPVASARFSGPAGIAFDKAGNLFVADAGNHVIRRISATGLVTTFAGQQSSPGTADGPAGKAQFENPYGIAFDQAGNLFVTDVNANTLRKIAPDGTVTTLAGSPDVRGAVDGKGSAALFFFPMGVTADAAGNIYVADYWNRAIRKVAPDGTVVTVAGLLGQGGTVNGVGSAARFGQVTALTMGASGNIDIGDSVSGALRCLAPDGTVSDIAGVTGSFRSSTDGMGPNADFEDISAIAVAKDGTVYVADGESIRQVTTTGWVRTLAGPISTGFSDGIGSQVGFGLINGLAFDSFGTLYISDRDDGIIRKAVLVDGTPTPGVVATSTPSTPALTVSPGSTVILQGSSTGPTTWSNWLQNGVALPAATGPLLKLTAPNTAGANTYQFAVGNAAGMAASSPITLQVSPTSDVGRLVNLSVLSATGSGASVLDAGFVLGGGMAASTRPLLVRGIGPGLSQFGVGSVLPDPTLTLFSGTQSISSNAQWGGSSSMANAMASVGAFALSPSSLDAALQHTFAAGAFTAQVTGSGAETGNVLAEIYDLAPGAPAAGPQLINVSARASVKGAAGGLTAGFSLGGATARAVLIRGVGPTLNTFGVPGVLGTPHLTLFSGSTPIASNVGWNFDATLTGIFSAVGAFPLQSSFDCALALTLPPGNYTAQVTGADQIPGVALIEVYLVP